MILQQKLIGNGYYNVSWFKIPSFNSNFIKLIAVFTMFLDHYAIAFMCECSTAYEAFRILGRMTTPIMCFFIAEGYHHTSDIKKYFLRLLIAAIISHFPNALLFGYSIWEFWHATSVMWALLCGLAALVIYNSEKLNFVFKIFMIGLCCFASYPATWNYIAVLWVLLFGICRDNKTKLAGFVLIGLIYITQWYVYGSSLPLYLRLGIFGAIPLLALYNGQRGYSNKVIQYGFYIFYPLHMLLLYFATIIL